MINKTIMMRVAVITFVAGYVLTGSMAYAAQPNGKPFQELQTQIDELNTKVINIEPDPRADSFFDVFFDIESYSVDSFFDIFTELQVSDESQQTQIDSFFDIFTELQAADTTLQTNINAEATARQAADTQLQSNIDNEAAARATADALLQTRVNGNCAVGSSIRQINSDGSVLCEPDDVGTGSSGRLIVVQRSGPTTEFSAEFPFRSSFALCLSGEMVVGGGYRASPATVNVSSESMESAVGGVSGWFVNAYHASGTGSITALAECASIIP